VTTRQGVDRAYARGRENQEPALDHDDRFGQGGVLDPGNRSFGSTKSIRKNTRSSVALALLWCEPTLCRAGGVGNMDSKTWTQNEMIQRSCLAQYAKRGGNLRLAEGFFETRDASDPGDGQIERALAVRDRTHDPGAAPDLVE
jgi:hypothetical protein